MSVLEHRSGALSPAPDSDGLAEEPACKPLQRMSASHRVHPGCFPHQTNGSAEQFISLRLHVQNPSPLSVSQQ